MNIYIAGINAASQEVFSTCEPFGVFVCDVILYIASINAASQEVLYTALGARINPVIKRYCVLLCSSESPARYTTINGR